MTAPTPRDFGLIARAGVLAEVRPESIERLLASATAVDLVRREALFRQGDAATGFFIVVDGVVKLYRITCAGEEAVIQVLTRGDTVAAASAFAGHRYLVTAEAVGPARVIRIPIEHVVRCICELPDVALAVITATSQHLGHLVHQVEELKAQNGFQRVAEFLTSLCPVASGPCQVTLPYGKTLIAGSLGIKPESLSRAFARLKSSGVDVRGSRVTIAEVGVLHELAAERNLPPPRRAAAAPASAWAASRRGERAGRQANGHAADLLLRRMAALDLDFREICRAEPRTVRDLQHLCTTCGNHRQCAADLDHDAAHPAWKNYCPNAPTLSALYAPV